MRGLSVAETPSDNNMYAATARAYFRLNPDPTHDELHTFAFAREMLFESLYIPDTELVCGLDRFVDAVLPDFVAAMVFALPNIRFEYFDATDASPSTGLAFLEAVKASCRRLGISVYVDEYHYKIFSMGENRSSLVRVVNRFDVLRDDERGTLCYVRYDTLGSRVVDYMKRARAKGMTVFTKNSPEFAEACLEESKAYDTAHKDHREPPKCDLLCIRDYNG